MGQQLAINSSILEEQCKKKEQLSMAQINMVANAASQLPNYHMVKPQRQQGSAKHAQFSKK